MKALINKIYVFILILSINSFFTLAASNLPHAVSLPPDMKKLLIWHITESSHDTKKSVIEDYRKHDTHKGLLTPHTIRPIDFVKAVNEHPVSLAQPDDQCYLDVQLWFKHSPSIFTKEVNRPFRLLKNTQDIDYRFFINDLPHCKNQFFDGMNIYDSGILAQTTRKSHVIYLINPHTIKKYEHIIYKPIYTGNGRLLLIMLHSKEDKIIFSARHCDEQYTEKPFKITIGHVTSVKNDVILTIDTETYLPFLIRQIIYLGKQTYLCVTNKGQLVVLWQDKNGRIQHCLQKHSSKMAYIAVDTTISTKDGFHPHIACLNYKHELFVCNLLAFAQPILFLIKQAACKKHRPFRLFYNNRHCGILYRAPNDTYGTGKCTNFIVWPDNLNERCSVWNWQNRK